MPLIDRSFSDIITFTRASSATMFDSSGTLVYAPMNAIRNNTMVGAVAGTPGTNPTNWSIANTLNGLTKEIVGTGTTNGITWIDLRWSGTTTGVGLTVAQPEGTTAITAATGQAWSASAWWAIVGGSTANITGVSQRVTGRSAAGSFLENTDTPVTLTATLTRYAASRTMVNASTERVTNDLTFGYNSGVAIDITLRIGLPQLELGSVARTAVATSGTAYQGPRFDYDPATLAARGFLIEEARTNLLTYSEEFDDASWATTDITVTADNTVAPDGTTTADLLTEGTAGTAFISRLTAATVSAGATVTTSVFVKRSAVVQWIRVRLSNSAATNGGNVWFDIQNGVLGNKTNLGSGTATKGTLTLINNGWYRVTVTTTLAAGDTTALLLLASASANGSLTRVNNSAYWAWGAQLEAGAFPTSYIPTTTTALTRSADVASVNTLSPWYNASEGTLFAEYVASNSSKNNGAAAFSDDTNNNRMIIRATSVSAQTVFIGVSSGATQWVGGIATALLNTITKSAFGYKVDDIAWVRNGGTVGTNTPPAIIPTVTELKLGADGEGTLFLNGYLRRITYYPRRLSNAELQAITA